jgi:hypothetical protein
MTRWPLLFALLVASVPVNAAEIAWDWPYEDSRVTHFQIRSDGVEVARTADADARSVQVDLRGNETLTGYACSPDACSPPSDPLWVPPGLSKIKANMSR